MLFDAILNYYVMIREEAIVLSTTVVNKDMHWIPGRLRINIPGLRKNQIYAHNLIQGLSALDGVQDIRPNIITGKVLITYNPSMLNINRLLTVINESISKGVSSLPRKFPPQTVRTAPKNVIPVIEPEDRALKQQWMHVIGGGSLLGYLLIKKILFRSSSLANNPVLSHLATATTLVSGYPVLKSGLASLTRGKISHDLLISLTAYSALILKENILGLATVWAVNLTSLLQALAVARSEQYIKARTDLNKVLVQSAASHEMIPVSQTVPGEIFSFQGGSLVPFKAKVHSGTGIINEITNSGKTVHRLVKKDDVLEPGNLIEAGHLSLEVLETPVASPVKICLGQGYLRQDNFINNFVKISFALSFLSFILTRDMHRSINMLLAAVPASYSLSAPTALCSAVRYQTRRGARILDAEQLLKAAHVDTFLFDKTGTLTTGQWEISHTIPLSENWTKDDILRTASNMRRSAGYGEKDPLASLINSSETASPPPENIILHSSGIRLKSQDDTMMLGIPSYISTRGVSLKKYQSQIKSLQDKGTVVAVLVKNRVPVGLIGLEEMIRPESYLLMEKLKQRGITRLGIVSGDTQDACLNVGRKLGINQVWGNLNEQEKGQIVREFRRLGCHVCMVGDGINDRTALRDAQVSITLKSMHYLNPIAESGIVLPENTLDRAADLIGFGKEVTKCVKNNKLLTGSLDVIGFSLASVNLLSPALSTLMANISILGVIINSTLYNFSKKL
ncbi:MAG: HAD-IC family P-type ATPase [Dehalobacterium sp.]